MTNARRIAAIAAATILPLLFVASLARAEEGTSQSCYISGQGYRTAWWQCYDGTESGPQGGESSCKPSETWNTYAQRACEGKCNKTTGKCGVNSFSVSQECGGEKICKPLPTSCPGEKDLNATMLRCKEIEKAYRVEKDVNGCRSVTCIDRPKPGMNDRTSCTNKAEIVEKIQTCEKSGGKPLLKRDGNCPVFAGCETRPNVNEQPSCTNKADILDKIQSCEKSGGKPILKHDGKCPVFAGCETLPVTEQMPTIVSCKKWTDGNCTRYSCDDGAAWSSCKPKTTAPKPVGCGDLERMVKELNELLKKDPANKGLLKRGTELRLKWNACRGATKDPTSSVCRRVYEGSCVTVHCPGKEAVKTCKDASGQ